jgi:glycosyltransferase involved in cell wall biosynthesis
MTSPPKSARTRREIVVVSHYFDTHGGGIERTIRYLVSHLTASGGFNVVWAASDVETPEEESVARGITYLPMKSYNFIERLCGVPWPIWSLGSLRRMKEAIKRADIVWLQDAPYMGNIMAFRMARRFKKPLVITQHIGTVPYRNPFWRFLMFVADRVFTRRMLRLAQQTVFISDWVAEHYHRRVAFKSPVMIIPNGVDPKVYYPVASEERWRIRARFALRDDQPVLIFAGRFIEKKGLPVIHKLAEMLPEWRFWLAGQGPIDPDRWFLPNVHVFNERTGPSLAELYRAADLLILPSFGEGFPLVVQEAMACGLPILCSPATAAGSMLAKPFLLTATVDPASPARTASIWARRLKTQREFVPISEANKDLSQAAHYFWSWPKIANCYAEIFTHLVRQQDA